MRSYGIWLIIFAVGSALLPYAGMQFILFMWIDTWGQTVGYIIRGVMVALGLALIGASALQGRTGSAVQPGADRDAGIGPRG